MKIAATVYIPSDQPLAAPMARRMLARMRIAGYDGNMQVLEWLPSPCKDQWHIALGEFSELQWWLTNSQEAVAFSALDWPAILAFCDAHFPLAETVYTAFSDQAETGSWILPGEYWAKIRQPGLLDVGMAPPEWALGQALLAANARLAVAESCTGGGLAARLTDIPGASAYFDRGFITYGNVAKEEILRVRENTLATSGAVSEETVLEMLQGVLAHGDLGVAISGIAGPGGGTAEKPVGTVCIAWGKRGASPQAGTFHFRGDRLAVRYAAANVAMGRVLGLLLGYVC